MAKISVLLVGVGALFVGCEHEAEPPLTPASGLSPETQAAVDRVAVARCDREQRCNAIGPYAEYETRDKCISVMSSDAVEELYRCREGVEADDLRQCVGEIANEDCGGPIDKLSRWVSCRAADLCAD